MKEVERSREPGTSENEAVVRGQAVINRLLNAGKNYDPSYFSSPKTYNFFETEPDAHGYSVTTNQNGYYIRGNSNFTNGIYTLNVQTLVSMENDANLPELLKTVETVARSAGAKTLEINGLDVVNPKIIEATGRSISKFGFNISRQAIIVLK